MTSNFPESFIAPSDIYNQKLVSNVRPSNWKNTDPASRYNLVVLGAGTAGLVAKVALVEKHLMGGDCLNVGCVPSKALLRASRASADARDAGAFGVEVPEGTAVDFPAVMERLRRLRAGLSEHDSAVRYRNSGVEVFLGSGRFSGPDSIEVDGRMPRFSKAVIATGARAAVPLIPGLSEVPCLTNENLFTLTELPKRLAVIGAGPIDCEMAQAFWRFGSEVCLLETAERILTREDADAAALVQEAFRREAFV